MLLPPRSVRLVRLVAAGLLAFVVGLGVLGVVAPPSPAGAARSGAAAPPKSRPDLVVVVLDDLSLDLMRTMRHVRAWRRDAADFDNAFVVNSFCCPSRAATFTGQPPHLDGVRTNTSGGPHGPQGGWPAFRAHGGPRKSYNVALQRAGYRTGFVGKYLNEYEPVRRGGRWVAPPLVPGWTRFEAVSGEAYRGWGFRRTERRGDHLVLRSYPIPDASASARVKDRTYATTVIGDRAVAMIEDFQRTGEPYLVHVAPYGVHSRVGDDEAWPHEPRFAAAFADRPSRRHPQGDCGPVACRRLHVRDLPGAGPRRAATRPVRLRGTLRHGTTAPAPHWKPAHLTIGSREADELLRERAQMAQSLDRMLVRIRAAAGPEAYLLLTSDNGFHLRQHGLGPGKGTPYDTDTRVPLLVWGPDVVPGHRTQAVSNIDLAPTLEELAGRTPLSLRAGAGVAAVLRDPAAPGHRYAFFEHTHGPTRPDEPDALPGTGTRLDALPSYVAVRSPSALLVRLDLDDTWDGVSYAYELYRYGGAGWESRNVFARDHGSPYVADLWKRLRAFDWCEPDECRAAAE